MYTKIIQQHISQQYLIITDFCSIGITRHFSYEEIESEFQASSNTGQHKCTHPIDREKNFCVLFGTKWRYRIEIILTNILMLRKVIRFFYMIQTLLFLNKYYTHCSLDYRFCTQITKFKTNPRLVNTFHHVLKALAKRKTSILKTS